MYYKIFDETTPDRELGTLSSFSTLNNFTSNLTVLEEYRYKKLLNLKVKEFNSDLKNNSVTGYLKLIEKMQDYSKQFIEGTKLTDKLSEDEKEELLKIFNLFDIDIDKQVAYIRRPIVEDMILIVFLLYVLPRKYDLYEKYIDLLQNQYQVKLEHIMKSEAPWIENLIKIYEKSGIKKEFSDLTEEDWRHLLTPGQYKIGRDALYFGELNDLEDMITNSDFTRIRRYMGLEEKPKLKSVLKSRDFQINSMILLQQMLLPGGYHNNILSDDNIEFDEKSNKILYLKAICLDFDLNNNQKFGTVKKLQKEVKKCLYALTETKHKVIPSFIVNTQHGCHVVYRIDDYPYKENIELWNETVFNLINVLKVFGLNADEAASTSPLFTIRLPFMRQQKDITQKEYRTSLATSVHTTIYSFDDFKNAFSAENIGDSSTLIPLIGRISNDSDEPVIFLNDFLEVSRKFLDKKMNFNSSFNDLSVDNTKRIVKAKKIVEKNTTPFEPQQVYLEYTTGEITAIQQHDIESYRTFLSTYNLDNTEISWYDFCEYLKQINMHDIIGIKEKWFSCIFHKDKNPSAEIRHLPSGYWRYTCFSANCEIDWLNNISMIQTIGEFSFKEAVLWMAKVLNAKLLVDKDYTAQKIIYATEENMTCLNKDNLEIFDTIVEEYPWVKTLKNCFTLIQEAIKDMVIKNNEDGYYFPASEIRKPLSNAYLKQFAKENEIKMQSQSKINKYSNILINLGFVERLETIPEWDSLNSEIQMQSDKAYMKDVSYYRYKILTSSDVEIIKSKCKKIDDYFWNNHQKPTVKKISKKLLDEIFKS